MSEIVNGNLIDVEGGLYVPANEMRRLQPSPDGNDEAEYVSGDGGWLPQESFLPEDERKLTASAFGVGPRASDDPTNDA